MDLWQRITGTLPQNVARTFKRPPATDVRLDTKGDAPRAGPPTLGDTIRASASADQKLADQSALDAEGRLAALEDRLDLLVADFGRWTEYKAASADYVREFTAELTWYRRTRVGVVAGAAVIVVVLAITLFLVLRYSSTLFGHDPGHALTAVIVASIGGIVIISIAALKGAFTGTKDRNEGLPMPEHMKELVDVGKSLFGN